VTDFDVLLERSLYKTSERWNEAAKWGWYPCENININLSTKTLSSSHALAEVMIKRVEKALNDTQENVAKRFMHRKHVLDEAFRLHKEEAFIACIPLFLSQAEGMFQEGFGKSIYSRRNDKKKAISSIIEKDIGDAFNIFFDKLQVENQFSARSSQNETEDRSKGPNRNGILHGESEHLDYGSHVNSCKTITLMLYISWMVEIYRERTT